MIGRRATLIGGVAAGAAAGLPLPARAAPLPVVRVGVLSFGSVIWELDVVKWRGLDAAHGIDLRIIRTAGKEGAAVALEGGAVDAIVTDWFWVSRQRAAGADFTFAPFSRDTGGIYVAQHSGIRRLADLKGRKLGIAGGPVDKSWLLLRAYAEKTLGRDLDGLASPVFAAPPLLNHLALSGQIPAVLNFWQFDAVLAAAGFRPLVGMGQVFAALGISPAPPLLGWVFRDRFARAEPAALRGLLAASYAAKHALLTDDALWQRLRPVMHAPDAAVFAALRRLWRRGGITRFGPREIAAAEATFRVVARLGGPALVGHQSALAPGTFWPGFRLPG